MPGSRHAVILIGNLKQLNNHIGMAVTNTHLILNPAAGGGRAGRSMQALIPEIEKRFGADYTLHVTHAPSDATRIAREVSAAGARLIVAAGGDGTVQEVVNGMLRGRVPVNPSCTLGILDFGTGRGLAQTLVLPVSYLEQLDLIVHTAALPVDVGLVSFLNTDGKHCSRFFVSECQIGIGSAVAERVHSGYKLLGGRTGFGMVAMVQSICYRANIIKLQLDDQVPVAEKLIGLVIGNGSYCAGGMRLTPSARPDDGYLDVLCIHEMSVPSRLLNFPKIYSGRHIHSKHFTICQSRKIRLASYETLQIEADGELLGRLPCEVEILPAILKIKYKSHTHGSN
jgi:YegS/Rv2252/BmrU family lipid kinase